MGVEKNEQKIDVELENLIIARMILEENKGDIEKPWVKERIIDELKKLEGNKITNISSKEIDKLYNDCGFIYRIILCLEMNNIDRGKIIKTVKVVGDNDKKWNDRIEHFFGSEDLPIFGSEDLSIIKNHLQFVDLKRKYTEGNEKELLKQDKKDKSCLIEYISSLLENKIEDEKIAEFLKKELKGTIWESKINSLIEEAKNCKTRERIGGSFVGEGIEGIGDKKQGGPNGEGTNINGKKDTGVNGKVIDYDDLTKAEKALIEIMSNKEINIIELKYIIADIFRKLKTKYSEGNKKLDEADKKFLNEFIRKLKEKGATEEQITEALKEALAGTSIYNEIEELVYGPSR